MPRHQDEFFNDLGFIFVREENSFKACCVLCNRKLSNTGIGRLKSHRNYCTVNGIVPIRKKKRTCSSGEKLTAYSQIIENISYHSPISPVIIDLDDDSADLVNVVVPEDETETFCVVEPSPQSPTTTSAGCESNDDASTAEQTPPAAASKPRQRSAQKSPTEARRKPDAATMAAGLYERELKLLDERLCDFIFGCDIPPAAVESSNFRNFVAALRPAYAAALPSRAKLASQLLDAASDRCVAENEVRLRRQPSVLVIDEWQRGEYGPGNVLVALLQNAGAGDEKTFLKARHATDDDDVDDDGDFYATFVRDALRAAELAYETSVYAVVGDRLPDAVVEPDTALWRSPCYLGLANALARDIFDAELDGKVAFVLRQFKRPACHRALTETGGQPVPAARCDSWRSYRESYANFARNAEAMRAVVGDETFEPSAVRAPQRELARELLADARFVESVAEQATALAPVCELVETCGRADAGLADAAHAWLRAGLDRCERIREAFERRKRAALTEYALAAYFLHPKREYYERSVEMARAPDGPERAYFLRVQSFLLESLDADGVEAFDHFQNGLGIMKRLQAKNVQNPTVFWRTVKPHHPLMADVALRLLRIPAAASRVDRQFYRRSYAHDALAAADDDDRSPTFERCEKRLRVYYSRRSIDVASSEF